MTHDQPSTAHAEPEPEGASESARGGVPVGRIVAILIALAVAAVAVPLIWGVASLEREIGSEDRAWERRSLTSAGGMLQPGATAAWRDGVKVTVGSPRRVPSDPADRWRRPGETAVGIAVTYRNGGKSSFELEAYDDVETDGRTPPTPIPMSKGSVAAVPETLAPGEKITINLAFHVNPAATRMEFRTSASVESRSAAVWELPLP